MSNCGDKDLCQPCVAPKNAHIDDISRSFRAWLSAVTCIPWYKSHYNNAKLTSMFGVAEALGMDFIGQTKRSTESVDESLVGCESLSSTWEIQFKLTISDNKKIAYSGEEHLLTPGDIIMDLRQSYEFDAVRKAFPFSISEWGTFNSLVNDDDKCCWQDQSEMLVRLCIERKISRGAQFFNAACLSVCGGEIICPKTIEDC